jgi:hypothetical protein
MYGDRRDSQAIASLIDSPEFGVSALKAARGSRADNLVLRVIPLYNVAVNIPVHPGRAKAHYSSRQRTVINDTRFGGKRTCARLRIGAKNPATTLKVLTGVAANLTIAVERQQLLCRRTTHLKSV